MSDENAGSDPQENNNPEQEYSPARSESVDPDQDDYSQRSHYQNTLTNQFHPVQNNQPEQEHPPVRLESISLSQSNPPQESYSPNALTDQLNLVQREEAKGIFRLFSRQRSVVDGFCLVIFRKEEYRGSILSDDVYTEGDLKRRSERLGVRDRDTILRVNLGSRPLSISEKLGTSDGYTRSYTLDLEIRISDPRNFAQRYLQWSDPVKLARIAIEGYLQHNAKRKRHDDLHEDMLRDFAEQALREGTNRSFGIEVVTAHKITLHMDPTRSKELEIQQQGRIRETRIREESRIKQIEAQEETNIRKANVYRDAEVTREEIAFKQEQANLTAKFERIEDEKQRRYEMYMDGEKAEQRRIEEIKEDEHQSKREILKIQEANKKRDLMYFYEIQEQKRKSKLETITIENKRHQKLLQAAGEKRFEDNLDQIEYGQLSLNDLLNGDPEQQDIFQTPSRPDRPNVRQEQPRIEEATNRNRPAPETNDRSNTANTDTSSRPTPVQQATTSQPVPAQQQTPSQPFTQVTGTLPGILRQPNGAINITDLGMTLKKIELSAEQHAIAATQTPTAFSISALDEHGPAHKAQLTIGDIVIEINGEEPHDTQSILGILKSYKPGSSVAVCILRGEDLVNVDV